jgi:hypothetical protein
MQAMPKEIFCKEYDTVTMKYSYVILKKYMGKT